MTKLDLARQALAESDLDGWLLYDFRHSNPLLWELLELSVHSTRRVFLLLDRAGEARLLVHQVDAGHFAMPGVTLLPYRDRDELLARLRERLAGKQRVAMEYSPMGALPTLSYVDGGTLELVRSLGVEVASSAELAQAALCRLGPHDLASHERAAGRLGEIVLDAFRFIGDRLGRGLDEWAVAEYIRGRFVRAGMETDAGPIVSVNSHAGDPHYQPGPEASEAIRPGDWVLIDLWAREPSGIYADITWVAFAGRDPPARYREVFDVVSGARDAALAFIAREARAGRFPSGWEADRVAREAIDHAGYGPRFTHRLGHSLGTVVHGYGANLDGYETQDTRRLVPGLAFTIEPGVYLPDFGVRCEIDVYMEPDGPRVTSSLQREIVCIA